MDPIHIHATAPLAERVLLPGDPGRALLLAQSLLEAPRMFNHNRGLWGYSGTSADGRPLTVQSTGMGGPSAAIVVSELIELGATVLIRVGTCGALQEACELGELVVASHAIAQDGTSRALGAGARASADEELVAALQIAAGAGEGGTGERAPSTGPVVSTDLFYDARDLEPAWRAQGALAVEMESAAIFALAAARGVRAASLLVVSDLLHPVRRRIEPEALRAAELRLGEVALAALAGQAAPA